MANKQLQARLRLKYDTIANWTTNGSTFTPLQGEVCVTEIPSGGTGIPDSNSVTPPQYLLKVGDGTHTWSQLPYISGLAADVFAWAKKQYPEYADFFSSTSTDGQRYTNWQWLIQTIQDNSANYEYQLVASGTTVKLQKQIEGTSPAAWTDVSTLNTDGTYNASTNKIATQSTVTNAIQALDSTLKTATSTTSGSDIAPTITTPTADFKVLTGAEIADGKFSAGTGVNVKKVAATAAAEDLNVSNILDTDETTVLYPADDLQDTLTAIARDISAAAAGGVQSVGGQSGTITVGAGVTMGTGANAKRIEAKTTGYVVNNAGTGSDSINLDSSKIDSNYTTANTTNLATVASLTAALGTLDSTQDIVNDAAYTPSGSETATRKIEFYNVNQVDGKLTSTGATVQDTLYLTQAQSATNPIVTKNDLSGIVGAMVYKGTVNSNSDLPTHTTTGVQAGWTYVVATAGTYNGTACEVGDMIIVKEVTSSSITFNIINGENQVTNNAATISAGDANFTTLATVDGTNITAKVSVTAGSATIASVSGNTVTLKSGISQTGTTGTVGNSSGSDITLADVAKTGAAEDVSYDNTTSGLTATDLQDAVDELNTKIGTTTDDLSAATVTANKSIKITSQKSTGDITFKGTDYTGLTLVDDSATTKTDVTFTQANSGSNYTVTAKVEAMNVNNLYQSTSDCLVFYCGSSTVLV